MHIEEHWDKLRTVKFDTDEPLTGERGMGVARQGWRALIAEHRRLLHINKPENSLVQEWYLVTGLLVMLHTFKLTPGVCCCRCWL